MDGVPVVSLKKAGAAALASEFMRLLVWHSRRAGAGRYPGFGRSPHEQRRNTFVRYTNGSQRRRKAGTRSGKD
jgi:hypothetical protein